MGWGGIKRDATDALFSDYIRTKANWICERCKRDFSTRHDIFDCSHHYSRANKAVRFYEDNAAPLCRGCHDYFSKRPHEHAEFFKKRLGEKRFDALVLKANLPMKEKHDVKILRMYFKQEIQKLERCYGKQVKGE